MFLELGINAVRFKAASDKTRLTPTPASQAYEVCLLGLRLGFGISGSALVQGQQAAMGTSTIMPAISGVLLHVGSMSPPLLAALAKCSGPSGPRFQGCPSIRP